MDERLRIPQDPVYFEALGLAVVAFARLEWGASYCCEHLNPGYIITIEQKKKTAGCIARDFLRLCARVVDIDLREEMRPLSQEFSDVVEVRNGLLHGKPATMNTADGDLQRLSRRGSWWTIEDVNGFSDRCFLANQALQRLLRADLRSPGAVELTQK